MYSGPEPDEVVRLLSQMASEGLRDLLQTKHLYQKVKIDAVAVIKEAKTKFYDRDRRVFEEEVAARLATQPLTPSTEQVRLVNRAGRDSPVLTLLLDNVKVFCANCDRREAFRPAHYVDIANELREVHSRAPDLNKPPADFQLFALTYQCQGCKGTPETFVVRRQGWDFILEGRSPMEHVEVPAFIPKPEREFFRDAIIAVHAGKTLAAMFYLRTFIEQFARRQTGKTGKTTGDEIMAAYSDTLPAARRDDMPSLRHWYELLSEALHSAREDAELFDKARAEIEHHFDIRRVFKIPAAAHG
jgi:hypothetical protein